MKKIFFTLPGNILDKKLKAFETAGRVVLALLLMNATLPPSVAAQESECSDWPAQWMRQFGSPGQDQARGVSADASGVYVTGFIEGALPGQTSAGGWDAFVRKYDVEGNEVWTRQFGTPYTDWGTGISVGASGVYVIGSTRDASFLRKYDADGNEVWTRQVGTGYNVSFSGISLDAFGVYVTGHTNGSLSGQTHFGYYDAFVRKYDVDGNEVWTREFGTSDEDAGTGISVDASGVYVTGFTDRHAYYGNLDNFVRKYDADGNEVWTQHFVLTGTAWWGGPVFTHPSGISVDASGIYVVGITDGAFPGQINLGGNSDVFVRKYDAKGNEVWTRQLGTQSDDRSPSISVDASRVYVVGYTDGTFPGQVSAGDWDFFALKYDAEGNEDWTLQFGTQDAEFVFGNNCISVDATGAYMAGIIRGPVPGQTSSGSWDAFVLKWDNQPPNITCSSALTVSCTADVPAADINSVTTSDNCSATVTHVEDVITDQICANRFTLTRTYRATDPAGNYTDCSQVITVNDNVAPELTDLAASQSSLWPPNHAMRDIALSYTATDNCAINPTITITSNEPVNGVADGDTDPDWEIVDAHHIRLRSERAENGTGRIYTITVTIDDGCNPAVSASTQVMVGLNSPAEVQNIMNTVTQRPIDIREVIGVAKGFDVTAIPNPTNHNFTLTIRSSNPNDKIIMQVVDIYGRIIETRNVNADKTIKLGEQYRPGTYFVNLIQGKSNKQLRLVKLTN